jgi:hypothetical protein
MLNPSKAKRATALVAFGYFAAMAVALTFPGITPFNTIRPLVFGVPFVFAWYLCWILGALLVFVLLYWVFNE